MLENYKKSPWIFTKLNNPWINFGRIDILSILHIFQSMNIVCLSSYVSHLQFLSTTFNSFHCQVLHTPCLFLLVIHPEYSMFLWCYWKQMIRLGFLGFCFSFPIDFCTVVLPASLLSLIINSYVLFGGIFLGIFDISKCSFSSSFQS